MLDVLPLGLGMMDADGNVLLANPEWLRFIPTNRMPSRDPERVGRWRSWDEDGEPVQPVNFPSARALRGESVVPPVQLLYEADDGHGIWTSVASVPLLDADGSVTGIVSIIQDIDAAKQAAEALQTSERHSKLLLAELQHRVRNTLAIVRSIAQRTAENSDSVDEMLGHFRGRLDAFSRVQAALTRNVGGTVNLTSLIEDELVAHAAREGEQVSIDGPDIMLEPKTAERLSLALHELTTNAVKHGALTNDDGRIRICWQRKQANGSARLLLNWKESGVEIEEKPAREGFGMELLRRSLPYDLQAETKVELKRQGLEFHLDMPLRDPVDVG